ncbi:MAG: PKD domain-containing protein [Candidatus Cloacimonetes bacterium]|nr:PKD domain-containing protein [Candidatus Cloacimonadota bacterium]
MRRTILVLIMLLLIAAAFPYAGKPEANKSLEIIPVIDDNTEVMGNMRVDQVTGIPAALYNVNYPVQRAEPEAMARQYLRENADKLHIDKGLADIEFVNSSETATGYHVQFRQTFEGYPLYHSSIKININNNRVIFVMNGYQKTGNVTMDLNISESAALQIARNYLNISGKLNYQKTETMVYVPNLFKGMLVQKVVLVPAESSFGDWEILVDAGTGTILRVEDKACYFRETGSGWVFDPDPITNAQSVYGAVGFIDNGDDDSDSLTAQLKEVELLEITEDGGIYSLEGPFASIIDNEAPFTGLYTQDSGEFHYTRSVPNFEAVNVYYHIDHTMRYLQELMDYEIMPYQYDGGVHFDPHGLNSDVNAHYSPSTGHVAFGSAPNAVDAAEDHAIVLHELGHAIHDWITFGQLSQVEGLSEGCADYWAQSYTRSLGIYESDDTEYDWFGLWGLQPELNGSHMRVTNIPNHYPEGLAGEVHYDGQLWSSSLMSIYDLIGREYCDRDLWESISMTDANTNQRDAAYAFMQADIELNDGENMEQIIPVFTDRGYIAGPLTALFECDVTGGPSPVVVNFTDVSFAYPGPLTSWEWDFDDDGEIDSYEQNPTWTFSEAGLYSVSFTISDGENSNTLLRENYISVNTGVLVYEGIPGGIDFSGTYIYETLTELGIVSSYSNSLPSSLEGFSAVFLSYGNLGANFDSGTFPSFEDGFAIADYLQSGGKVYLESGSLFGGMEYIGYPNYQLLRQLFGMQSAQNFFQGSNPINELSGLNGTVADGMTYTSSTQVNNWYIDKYFANGYGSIAFSESGFGNVGLQGSGIYGQKTFAFAYSLAELVDNGYPSTREEFLIRLIDFFGIPSMTAMFEGQPYSGFSPLPVIFFDNSLALPEVIAWAWDFENDGVIDSNEETPIWVYYEPGYYDVSLTIDNGYQTQTVVMEDYIRVFVDESALEFNGIDSYLECSSHAGLDITEAITLEAWINPTGWGEDANAGYGRIFDKNKFRIYLINSQGTFADHSLVLYLITEDGNSFAGTPENSITLNTWQHVAVSYDGIDEVKMYINGVDQELTYLNAPSGNIESNLFDDLYIGNSVSGGYTFQGVLDELRLWDTVVSGENIAANMTEYLAGNETGLKGYWKLNDAMGATASDETVNGNDCTIHNALWTIGTPFAPVINDDWVIENGKWKIENYPNPFNPTTTISYYLPEDALVELTIYNVKGQKIKTLEHGNQPEGNHSVIWNGNNAAGKTVSSGIYFYELRVDGRAMAIRKCLMFK